MTVNKAKIIERIILRICKDFEFADKISPLIFPPRRIIRRLNLFLIQEISSLETRKGVPLFFKTVAANFATVSKEHNTPPNLLLLYYNISKKPSQY